MSAPMTPPEETAAERRAWVRAYARKHNTTPAVDAVSATMTPEQRDAEAAESEMVADRGAQIIPPYGCGLCGLDERAHGRQWVESSGWHTWKRPDDRLVLARMRARRSGQSIAGAPMTPNTALIRLRQYGERTSTWSTATYDSGTERELYEIALTLAAEVNQLSNDLTGAFLDRHEEEQDSTRLRLALQSARRGRRELRVRITELEAAPPWERAVAGLNALVDAGVDFHVEPDGHISAPFSDEHIEWDLRARRWVLTHDDEDDEPEVTPDPLAYGPTGYRCGCGKDAHSNLTPCQPMTADEWNARHPVGTPVLAYPGTRDAEPLDTVTRTPAWTLGHGAAVVSVEGEAGGICLTHVDPIADAAQLARFEDARHALQQAREQGGAQ
ncbi:hypothetical protein ACFCV8_00755 [Streptomyces sp. NPDC056347]|uniref:hypothetical protein n=1 Tax=Streptomyces sp. NPDC056347 TaxID=3345790 RepID=UPI0035E04B8D